MVTLLAACKSEDKFSGANESSTLHLVDPFVGTGGHGHTFPGATLPFGMVQLSPDNGTEGWDWCSGYHYSDSMIAGFSHLHLSGTGIGDLYDISLMPYYASEALAGKRAKFSHRNETAKPGYYSVMFDNGITTELTTTQRTGMHRYTFPADSVKCIAINLGFSINWDKPTDALITQLNDTLITGYRMSTGWAKDQRVFFAAVFSQPMQSVRFADQPKATTELRDPKARAICTFAQGAEPLFVKVGISSASVEGALANLQAETAGLQFNQAVAAAGVQWEAELGKIRATLISKELDTVFATALYHTAMAPNLYSDVQGGYKAADHTVRTAKGFERYTVFSLWDTFRASHPLFTLTQPERLNNFFQSIMAFYDEHGLLPVWALMGNETNTMTGYHAVPVLADAILKGLLTENLDKVYEAMLASAGQSIRGSNFYREYGYIPADKYGWSVTKTLEYAFDDWCIAQVAKKLGKADDYRRFTARAAYYANLFEPTTGFMRAKNSQGAWLEPFDPFHSEHGFEGMYIEGTAWQHTWFVPHDVAGLIALYGSPQAFVQHLDSIFEVTSEMTGENVSVDISGLIGQYAHGNEPSHHVAYLFSYAGQPWKTQERVRQIMKKMYTTGPEGLAGNDDCGQMSAWFVFSALGFYPVNPADGNYVLGSPLVTDAQIRLGEGRTFRVSAKNNSEANSYVQSVSLNGKALSRSFISHAEIMAGGELVFTMGPEPNTSWATRTEDLPPSMSTQ
jgi:predicted alpha-1,2-mannosidase